MRHGIGPPLLLTLGSAHCCLASITCVTSQTGVQALDWGSQPPLSITFRTECSPTEPRGREQPLFWDWGKASFLAGNGAPAVPQEEPVASALWAKEIVVTQLLLLLLLLQLLLLLLLTGMMAVEGWTCGLLQLSSGPAAAAAPPPPSPTPPTPS